MLHLECSQTKRLHLVEVYRIHNPVLRRIYRILFRAAHAVLDAGRRCFGAIAARRRRQSLLSKPSKISKAE